jgi:hypothetical protein
MSGRINVGIRDARRKRLFEQCREAVAADREVDPDDLANVETFEAVASEYLALAQLRADDRFSQTVDAIANDHGIKADEISDLAALKVALGAYNGFNSGLDWPAPEDAEDGTGPEGFAHA